MSVRIKLRLPVPEGRPGDVVEVSNQRAEALVDRRYATYVSGGNTAPAVEATYQPPVETAETVDTGAGPVTDLPASTDKKAEWEKAAANLGIDIYREDGSNKSKTELIDEVKAATS